MKRAILAALVLGATPALAMAQATVSERTLVYDQQLGERFDIKREIVDQVQAIWGETAAYETGQELPTSVNTEIVPGKAMPEGAPVEPVPAALDDLPKLVDDSRWVKSGTHLIELKPDNTIAMVVYNVLP